MAVRIPRRLSRSAPADGYRLSLDLADDVNNVLRSRNRKYSVEAGIRTRLTPGVATSVLRISSSEPPASLRRETHPSFYVNARKNLFFCQLPKQGIIS